MDQYQWNTALQELENKRKQIRNGWFCILAGAPCLLVPPVGLALLGVGYYLFTKGKQDMAKLYKEAIVRAPLQYNFGQVNYQPKGGLTRQQIEGIGLCFGDNYYTEDYIQAAYHGVTFQSSDVHIVDVHHTKDGDTTTTLFKGRMMMFEFPQKLVQGVHIFSKNFKNRTIKDKGNKYYNKVEMESVEFNNLFDTYGMIGNEHDVFYFFTPQLMERLTYLNGKYESIAMHATNNMICFAFNEPNNNAFDYKSTKFLKNFDVNEEMAKVQADIDDIKILIDVVMNTNYQRMA